MDSVFLKEMVTLHHLKNQIDGVIGKVGGLFHRRAGVDVGTMPVGILNDFQIRIFALIHPQGGRAKDFPGPQNQHTPQHIGTDDRSKIWKQGRVNRLKFPIHPTAMLNGYIANQILRAFINGEYKRNPIHFIQIIFKLIFRIFQSIFRIVQAVFGHFN